MNTFEEPTDFGGLFAQAIGSVIGITRDAPEVPSEVWQQTLRLAADYVEGYRLLYPYREKKIAFVGGSARPMKQSRSDNRQWMLMTGELGYQLACHDYVVVTGGAPPNSLMASFINGALKHPGAQTVCLDIAIPHGDGAGLIDGTPFHRFASLDPREAVAWAWANYLGFAPGAFGTKAEIFRAATITQLGHKPLVPIHLICPDFWELERKHLQLSRAAGVLPSKYMKALHFTRFTTVDGVRRHVAEVTRKIDARNQREPRILRLPMAHEVARFIGTTPKTGS